MNPNRKKELLYAYSQRKPEMGIIAVRCTITDELFVAISKDTKASLNSTKAKLKFISHPNKRLQELWNNYSLDKFEFYVDLILEYKDPNKDHTKELNKLLEKSLKKNKGATLIWK